MALVPVNFEYLTGLRQPFLVNARLTGNWDAQGRRSEQWTEAPMTAFTAEDGCPAFRATDQARRQSDRSGLPLGGVGRYPAVAPMCGVSLTEVNDTASAERYRTFTLQGAGQTERYYLTHCRRLGANKLFVNRRRTPAIRFAVWAPERSQRGIGPRRDGGRLYL